MEKKEAKMTIEELSEEYVKSTLIGSESIKKSAFKAGGNAVLKEIEWILEQGYYSNKNILIEIRNLVDELKNE